MALQQWVSFCTRLENSVGVHLFFFLLLKKKVKGKVVPVLN
jgi:hypothetical protein